MGHVASCSGVFIWCFVEFEGRIPERQVNKRERQNCACVHVEGTRGCGGIVLFLRCRH